MVIKMEKKYTVNDLSSRNELFEAIYATLEEASLLETATTIDELMELAEQYINHLIERGELDEAERDAALELARRAAEQVPFEVELDFEQAQEICYSAELLEELEEAAEKEPETRLFLRVIPREWRAEYTISTPAEVANAVYDDFATSPVECAELVSGLRRLGLR